MVATRSGGFYYRQHRLDDAIAQLREVVKLTPDNTQAYNNLAGFYLISARPQDLALAEQALKKSIEISPSYPAFGNVGLLYMQAQRPSEAAEMARRAVELNDKDFLAWENLDWAHRWDGQTTKAQVAVATRPSNSSNWRRNRGLATLRCSPILLSNTEIGECANRQ